MTGMRGRILMIQSERELNACSNLCAMAVNTGEEHRIPERGIFVEFGCKLICSSWRDSKNIAEEFNLVSGASILCRRRSWFWQLWINQYKFWLAEEDWVKPCQIFECWLPTIISSKDDIALSTDLKETPWHRFRKRETSCWTAEINCSTL